MKTKKILRIGYFGDGPWAHDALRRLLADKSLSVVFVSPRFHNPDPQLSAIARDAGIPILHQPNVNAPESLERIKAYSADLLVSMSYDQIIRKALLDAAPLGFVNCHAGKLPFYRGRNILNWALINGEKEFGITVHFIDEGIDTGPIILQETIPIGANDDYSTLLIKAQERCGGILYKAIDALRRGRAKTRVQSKVHPVGFYCGRRRSGDEMIDWEWTSVRIHNFVRGVTAPAPGARTHAAGRELAILKTALIPRAPGYLCRPGEVVGRDATSAVVKTGDSTIRILSVADVDSSGNLAEVRSPGLRIGDRLGLDLQSEVIRLTGKVASLEAIIAGIKNR